MRQTLIDLFTSKKFLAAVTAVVVYAAGRFGFDVDTATLDRIFAAFLVYIGAQGVADHGKGAEEVRAATWPRMPPGIERLEEVRDTPAESPRALATLAGKLPIALLLVLGLAGATQVSCAGQSPRVVAANAVTAELDCTAPAIAGFAVSLGRGAEAYLASKIANDGRAVDMPAIKSDLKALGSQAWSCALSTALAVLLNQPVARTSPMHVSLSGPSLDALRGAVGELKAELGVATVRTPAGVL
jgi:hypothetical protein